MLKNIYEVNQLMYFRCIMSLSYRVTFHCNIFRKLIIHQKVLYDYFYEKVVKWCNDINLSKSMGGGREFFDLLESKIQTPKIVRRMHFNNVNKERHYEYGGQYDSSELVF